MRRTCWASGRRTRPAEVGERRSGRLTLSVRSSRATLLHYLGQHKLRIASGVVIVALSAFVAVLPPLLIGRIVDALTTGADLDIVTRLALLMVALAGAENVLRGLGRWRILDASRQIEYRMRDDLLAHLQRMHLAYFQHQRIGDLMARLTNDLSAVRMMQGPGIMNILSTSMIFVFSVLSMISVSLKLTIIALILMPLASLTFWYIGRTVHLRFERLQSQFGDMSTKAQENFSGIRVVKAFSQEAAETKDFAAVNHEYFRRAVALSAMQGLIWPSISFILGIAVLSVLYVGGQDAIRGELSIGALVQFVAYLYLLQMPMINIGWISNMFQAGW